MVQDELTCTQTLQTWHHPSRKLNKEAKFNERHQKKKVTDFNLMKLNTITKGNAAV